MKVIASSDNKEYKRIRSLQQKKYRDRLSRYLVEGENLVMESLSEGLAATVFIRDDRQDLYDRFAEKGVHSVFLTGDLFRKVAQTETSQGILAEVEKRTYSGDDFARQAKGNILVLDGLQDPGNLGTILRTAAAAGYGGAVILKGTADVYAPKVVRAAAGALFRLPLYFAEGGEAGTPAEEAAALLGRMGRTIVGTTPRGGVSYLEADLSEGIALVIGNEGNGMSEEMLAKTDKNIYIPMHTGMESLNAAVAAGILMYKSIER
ncbi:MAG: RNA methyltransferase [Clostridiales bacterium]|nr:RNA methyltransferase [Clostridiales bacterium]